MITHMQVNILRSLSAAQLRIHPKETAALEGILLRIPEYLWIQISWCISYVDRNRYPSKGPGQSNEKQSAAANRLVPKRHEEPLSSTAMILGSKVNDQTRLLIGFLDRLAEHSNVAFAWLRHIDI